jgi:hypothetical protein
MRKLAPTIPATINAVIRIPFLVAFFFVFIVFFAEDSRTLLWPEPIYTYSVVRGIRSFRLKCNLVPLEVISSMFLGSKGTKLYIYSMT